MQVDRTRRSLRIADRNEPNTTQTRIETKQYELNQRRAIRKQLDLCNLMSNIMHINKLGNHIYTMNTSTYKLYSAKIIKYFEELQNEPNHQYRATVTNRTDKKGVTVEHKIQIHTKTATQRKGTLRYCIMLYHTTAKFMVNGRHPHLFLEDHNRITQEIQNDPTYRSLAYRTRQQLEAELSNITENMQSRNETNNGTTDTDEHRQQCQLILNQNLNQSNNQGWIQDNLLNSSIELEQTIDRLDNSLTFAKETNNQDVPTIQQIGTKDDEVWTCPICTMEANRNTIECTSCLNWIHFACEKLKEKEIKQFTENDQLEFICSSCKQLNDNMIDEFILPRSDECTDLEEHTRDMDTNVIPRECHELNSTNEDSGANPTSKSNNERPTSPTTKEQHKECNRRTQHRSSESNIDEKTEIDEDVTILKAVANLQTTAKQKTAKIFDKSPQLESTESKIDENRVINEDETTLKVVANKQTVMKKKAKTTINIQDTTQINILDGTNTTGIQEENRANSSCNQSNPAVDNQAISQQTQKPKKQKKPFKLNDTEQQLAACRAEIAR
ncbi:unnamed protein product [Mytilus edulis]|uniref:Zinc finger PHD-type domain-containing protein n=1 Tax=Mytilus edulis TaxID=6550 RepID=A0A8S3PXG3_MYTED|nr:unnamed protein product [Mytilus edulis]